jgi:hypothetical protein
MIMQAIPQQAVIMISRRLDFFLRLADNASPEKSAKERIFRPVEQFNGERGSWCGV